jgi:predicted metal-dependent HD superfamily phosphohydrolase
MEAEFAERFPDLAHQVKARYDEPHRHYHGWAHIVTMLSDLAGVRDVLEDPEAVELAVWYHDAIYDPHAGDNELKSAELMMADLAGKIDSAILERAAAMIRATFGHTMPEEGAPADLRDCAAFLDLDLSILGADQASFDAYDRNIRKEYDFVPDELYRPGRRAVLEGFLGRPRLYFTEFASGRLELAARTNLQRAIDRLA